MVVVEHNLPVIAAADWVLDIGPGAGDEGGRVVVAAPPVEVARTKASQLAGYLARYLAGH